MHREPFGLLEPLKYALDTLVSQWRIALGFALLLLLGEAVGFVAIVLIDILLSGGQLSVVFAFYSKLLLEYQKMTNFELNHEIWFHPLVQSWPISVCAGLALILFFIWIEVGLVETALQYHDTGKTSVKSLVSRSYGVIITLVPLFLMTLGIFIFLALALNYLPFLYYGKERADLFHTIKALLEIYIFFRVAFVAFYVIDHKSSLIDAMKHAYHPVNWQGGQLFEAYFAVYLFDIGAGFIPFIGRAIGIWVFCFAEVYMYRKVIPYGESNCSAL